MQCKQLFNYDVFRVIYKLILANIYQYKLEESYSVNP